MSANDTQEDKLGDTPADMPQKPDPSESKLKLSSAEREDWLDYKSIGVRPFLNKEMVKAILASADPGLVAVQEKVREAITVTPLERDIFVLAKRASAEGELEFDPDAPISMGEDNGAYVGAFHWVDFSDTPLDQDVEQDDEPDGAEATPRERG